MSDRAALLFGVVLDARKMVVRMVDLGLGEELHTPEPRRGRRLS